MTDPVMWGILIGVTASAVVYGVCRALRRPWYAGLPKPDSACVCDPRKGLPQ